MQEPYYYHILRHLPVAKLASECRFCVLLRGQNISDEAYAVSNAVDELKQVATAVIESNDEDGVAKWLRCTKLVDNASRGM